MTSIDAPSAQTPPPRYDVHRAIVTATAQLSPHFVRITFGGPGLRAFQTFGAAAKTKLFLPVQPEAELVLPHIDENHQIAYPEGVRPAITRTYTVRRHRPDVGEVDVDFVIHPDGPAGRWASTAQPGSVIGVSDGGGQLPPQASDILFVGDPSSLPAIETLVEGVRTTASSRIIVVTRTRGDEVPLSESLNDTASQWVYAPYGADAGQVLVDTVRAELAHRSAGYVWAAGESASLKPLRTFLRTEAGFSREDSPVAGYWRHTMTTDQFENDLFTRARQAVTAGAVLTPEDIAEMSVEM